MCGNGPDVELFYRNFEIAMLKMIIYLINKGKRIPQMRQDGLSTGRKAKRLGSMFAEEQN